MRLDGDDKATMRGAIELSYNTLRPDLARLFRFLGVSPGLDFDHYAAASLAGISPSDAQRMLGRLAATNLIHSVGAGRCQFHDLIRDYARDQARHESLEARRLAYSNLFDFYTHTANTACQLLYADLYPTVTAPPPHIGPGLLRWGSHSAALAWLNSEVDNLVAVACYRGKEAETIPVWQLAAALLSHLLRQRHDTAWHTVFTAGLDAAARHDDRAAIAAMQRGLGQLSLLRTDYTKARSFLLPSLKTFRTLADPVEEARVLVGLASAAAETGEYAEALKLYNRTLSLLGDSDAAAVRAMASLGKGIVLHMIGSDQALRHLANARTIAEEMGLRHISTRADAVVALNDMWIGRLEDALAGFGRVLSTWQTRRFRQGVAETLRNMAETHLEADRFNDSLELAERALSVAQEVGHAWTIIGSTATLGITCLRLGEAERAATHLNRVRDLTQAGLRYWHASATLGLAEYHRARGELEMAAQLANEVLSDPRPRERGRAYIELARASLASADWETCRHHAAQARQIASEKGYRLEEARASQLLGEAYSRCGDTASAQVHLQVAWRRFAEARHRAADQVRNLINDAPTR
jgi:tetratricopeptide (TPR) repeat protein